MARIRSKGKVKHVKQRSWWRKIITFMVFVNLLGTIFLILKDYNLV